VEDSKWLLPVSGLGQLGGPERPLDFSTSSAEKLSLKSQDMGDTFLSAAMLQSTLCWGWTHMRLSPRSPLPENILVCHSCLLKVVNFSIFLLAQ
jgi:hypothetical protein